jgi:hydrogenase-4 component B
MDYFLASMGIVLVGGVLPLLLSKNGGLCRVVGALTIASGCGLGLFSAGTQLLSAAPQELSYSYQHAFSLAFSMDGLSAFFLLIIFAISAIAAIYSYDYMDRTGHTGGGTRTGAHYLFFSLLTISMALVVTADNMITFMISWELMSLSSFFLVVHDHEKEENRRAGYLYFVFSHVGAAFIFAAFGVLYAHTGSFDFAGFGDLPEQTKLLVFVLALIGFGSKAGVFPLHIWLPHAHPAAPSHISAVMSGVMIKIGIYGIIKIYLLLEWQALVFGEILIGVGIVTGILGVVYALGQRDLKRLLAYSSVENVGIILLGLGIGMVGNALDQPVMAALGFAGGLLHILNHSIFKSLLFLGAGMVVHKTGTRSIDKLGGLLKGMKVTGLTFLFGSLAIAGLPPFNGFVSEFLIYIGSFQGLTQNRTILALGLVTIVGLAVIGGLALACFTRVIGVVFQGAPRSKAAEGATESGPSMLLAMLILAAACLAIGVYPRFYVNISLAAATAGGLVEGAVSVQPFVELTGNISMGAAIFFGLVLLVALLRYLLYRGKQVTRAGTWGCGFTQPTAKMQYTSTSYSASILDFFKRVAPLREEHPPITGRFPQKTHYESHVEDLAEGNMRWIVRPVLALFDKLRWIQHGDVHLYVGYILLTIVVLLFFI